MTNGTMKLNLKDSKMSLHEDPGFCSGEDYMEVHSPTDSSEDSVEVKVSAIKLNHAKRTLDGAFTGPLKKRMCLKVKAEETCGKTPPFRPWSPPPAPTTKTSSSAVPPSFAVPFCPPAAAPYFRPPSPQPQNEPVSLVVIKRETDSPRVPVHPQSAALSAADTERMILTTNEQFPSLSARKAEQKREQRNYKNMTRERRIEANARERTRVHTISAAFDTLRRSVPAYSHNQKLSKLSVLRIACSYIMTLSSLVQEDDNNEEPSTSECVDLVSRTIQREGKLRKKKDDND